MVFHLVGVIGELGEVIDWFRAGFAGWRFLFSASYRSEIMAKWRVDRWYEVAFDVVIGLAGIGLTLAVAVGIGLLIFGGISAMAAP